MQSKMKFILPLVVLLVLGGAYKTVLAKPKDEPKPKVEGQIYVIPKEFLINLAGQRYAKLTAGLVLPHDAIVAPEKEKEGGAKPPEGWGTLPQEAVVRRIITDTLTDVSAKKLIDREAREKLAKKILKKLKKSSDVDAEEVFFSDVTVQ